MTLVVQKYGGTSVDGSARIRAVAGRVAAARAAGDALVVVVSARGGETDRLLALAREVSSRPSRRELDMLLTTGERVSMALLAMALGDLGIDAISFTGSQSGILTDAAHNAARIVGLRPERIRSELERGRVVIVAGFQGVHPETREITTLGRGGSDTSAVALAAGLGGRCEIYTDVEGVMTADPRLVTCARLIPRMSYRVCSTLAHLGGRVLHARSVDLAAAHRVPLVVRSSFTDGAGTEIVEDDMEGPLVQAVAQRAEVSIVIAEGTAAGRGEARAILAAVADQLPGLELVAHEQDTDAHGALVWIGAREDAERLERDFGRWRGPGGEWRVAVTHDAAFVSVVGLGLGAREAVRGEAALERAGVPMVALRLAPTALIWRVAAGDAAAAARALHAAFLEERAAG
jgi:aspartate kinase